MLYNSGSNRARNFKSASRFIIIINRMLFELRVQCPSGPNEMQFPGSYKNQKQLLPSKQTIQIAKPCHPLNSGKKCPLNEIQFSNCTCIGIENGLYHPYKLSIQTLHTNHMDRQAMLPQRIENGLYHPYIPYGLTT